MQPDLITKFGLHLEGSFEGDRLLLLLCFRALVTAINNCALWHRLAVRPGTMPNTAKATGAKINICLKNNNRKKRGL